MSSGPTPTPAREAASVELELSAVASPSTAAAGEGAGSGSVEAVLPADVGGGAEVGNPAPKLDADTQLVVSAVAVEADVDVEAQAELDAFFEASRDAPVSPKAALEEGSSPTGEAHSSILSFLRAQPFKTRRASTDSTHRRRSVGARELIQMGGSSMGGSDIFDDVASGSKIFGDVCYIILETVLVFIVIVYAMFVLIMHTPVLANRIGKSFLTLDPRSSVDVLAIYHVDTWSKCS